MSLRAGHRVWCSSPCSPAPASPWRSVSIESVAATAKSDLRRQLRAPTTPHRRGPSGARRRSASLPGTRGAWSQAGVTEAISASAAVISKSPASRTWTYMKRPSSSTSAVGDHGDQQPAAVDVHPDTNVVGRSLGAGSLAELFPARHVPATFQVVEHRFDTVYSGPLAQRRREPHEHPRFLVDQHEGTATRHGRGIAMADHQGGFSQPLQLARFILGVPGTTIETEPVSRDGGLDDALLRRSRSASPPHWATASSRRWRLLPQALREPAPAGGDAAWMAAAEA